MRLTAILPVLYRSRQYKPGDTLPGTDEATVTAWLESGAARWIDEESVKHAPKAQLTTAEPGKPGKSSDGNPDALIGKVPERAPGKTSVPKTKKR